MNWESPTEFFAMGGHGLYVWGSFAVAALLMIIEMVLVKIKCQRTRQRMLRLAQARQKAVKEDES